MCSLTCRYVRTQAEPAVYDLIQLNVPPQVFRNEAGVGARPATEIKRLDRRRVNQHVEIVAAIQDGDTVHVISRDRSRRITAEAPNVQGHLVIEKANASSNHRPIIFERGPGKAKPWSRIPLPSNALILKAYAHVEA